MPDRRRPTYLPPNLEPAGIDRLAAAEFVGVCATTFDTLVRDGLMPNAKRVRGRLVWSVRRLREAFDALPGDAQTEAANPWSDAA